MDWVKKAVILLEGKTGVTAAKGESSQSFISPQRVMTPVLRQGKGDDRLDLEGGQGRTKGPIK